jgi:hypothetical protein
MATSSPTILGATVKHTGIRRYIKPLNPLGSDPLDTEIETHGIMKT